MLYPPGMDGDRARGKGPIGTGFRYGMIGVLVALVSDLYFLVIEPTGMPGWVLAVIAQYRTRLALALFLFLAVLAALKVRPTRLDPGCHTGRCFSGTVLSRRRWSRLWSVSRSS